MADKDYQKKLKAWRERRKKIVSLRDDSNLTFDEIAKIYDVSRQRILQIYKEAQ
jgi:DNA-directed RNA polymerase specialized sigma subunit